MVCLRFALATRVESLFLEGGPSGVPTKSLGYLSRPLDLWISEAWIQSVWNWSNVTFVCLPNYPILFSTAPLRSAFFSSELRYTEYLTFPSPSFMSSVSPSWPLAVSPQSQWPLTSMFWHLACFRVTWGSSSFSHSLWLNWWALPSHM